MSDINVGYLASTTLEDYQPELVDNIFKDIFFLNHWKKNGGIDYKTGGRRIVQPLLYGSNTTTQAFDNNDKLDTTAQEGIDAAFYYWKHYNTSVVVNYTDLLLNDGDSEVIDLLEARINQAESSLMERFSNDLFNGAGSDAKEITGVETAVGTTNTYGAIDGNANAFWRSYVESTSTALTIAYMRTAVNTVNLGKGGGKCSIIIGTQTLYESYESKLTATPQYMTSETKRLGDGGFQVLEFKAIPFGFDEQCTSLAMYFLNTKNLRMKILKKNNFKIIKKSDPADQHISIQHISVSANTAVNRRGSLGKLTAKTA